MRQASWNEIFAARHEPLALAADVPEEPRGWRRLLWWEDLVTFGLLTVLFLTVIAAIQRADWVDDMPSLYPVAFLGLLMGALLARVRWPEGFIHLVALPVGLGAVLLQVLRLLPGDTPLDRCEVMVQRMGDWFGAAFNNGISNDSLPVIILVVTLSWLGAYLSAWAVFRWQNAWLALAPGSAALVTNASLQIGEFSLAVVIFLFGAALLVTRLHLLQRAKAWRDDGTPYPPLLSLSVLHATFWLALALLAVAWVMPQANESAPLDALWQRTTAPIEERTASFARLFVAVNTENVRIHSFGETMPFHGDIDLSDALIMEVVARLKEDQPAFLRAKAYDVYGPSGWTLSDEGLNIRLERSEITDTNADVSLRELRSVLIQSAGRTGGILLTQGQPWSVDLGSRVRTNTEEMDDIIALISQRRLHEGDTYETTGSVSTASELALRNAGEDYPDWTERYTQLPDDRSDRVSDLADRVAGAADTPYDQALAIETHLRDNYQYDLAVPNAPPGQDAIEYFLFNSRRGYFDYHASAMVVLLRELGIPSRLAVGYVLDEGQRSQDGGSYRVTERAAYAWPEVYFPGLGWVEFNPTPDRGTFTRPTSEASSEPEAPDPIDFPPNPFAGDVGGFPTDDGSDAAGAVASGASGRAMWVLIGVLAGVAALVSAGTAGLSYAWLRGLAGLPAPARLWGQTVRLAAWARVPPEPAQTPQEYARSLQSQVPGMEGVSELADAYVRQQYGQRDVDDDERPGLERAWRSVRRSLVRRLLRLR
ncbi:MAG: transglutaminase domain-containing protein [Dehalococcoidia bacterium]